MSVQLCQDSIEERVSAGTTEVVQMELQPPREKLAETKEQARSASI